MELSTSRLISLFGCAIVVQVGLQSKLLKLNETPDVSGRQCRSCFAVMADSLESFFTNEE